MARTRSNGITGTEIRLNTYFYKNEELESPSSIKKVEILTKGGSILETYSAVSISTLGTGIKKLQFTVPLTWSEDHYFDRWYYVSESGVASSVQSNEFIVRASEWEQKIQLIAGNYSLKGDLETEKVALYDKKWIKFSVNDALGNLQGIDEVTVMFKDYDGSNLYISDPGIPDELLVYYYFNSSSLQADYPTFINRTSVYEWVLEISYRGETIRIDPIAFKFSA